MEILHNNLKKLPLFFIKKTNIILKNPNVFLRKKNKKGIFHSLKGYRPTNHIATQNSDLILNSELENNIFRLIKQILAIKRTKGKALSNSKPKLLQFLQFLL